MNLSEAGFHYFAAEPTQLYGYDFGADLRIYRRSASEQLLRFRALDTRPITLHALLGYR